MGGNVTEIRDEALEILRVEYPKVKAGMLRLEVFVLNQLEMESLVRSG